MTTFQGGPANGQTLILRRAPFFLRVVVKGSKIDALDQLTNSPRPGERIYIYRRVSLDGAIHIHARGGRGGWRQSATYILHNRQAPDKEVRSTAAWQQWTRREAEQMKLV